MSKVEIRKDDNDRSILTDVLPYETPIIFSNEGLYNYKKKLGNISNQSKVTDGASVIQNLLSPNKKYTVPYEYLIRNNVSGLRKLAVVHPKSQLAVSDFYSKFDHQILHLCSLSPAALRYPSSIASHYYEPRNVSRESSHKKNIVEQEASGFDGQTKRASSYFSYKKYNYIYKFYDSFEFLSLEKKYHNLMIFDISKCFSSIYTHSISWAVKDKEFSKEHKDTYSFESQFDVLMQNSNYNETNGIVIGPEASRVFAEVILQRIDCDSIKEIDLAFGVTHNIDYSIRRYIDDYHVFSRDKDLEDKIFIIIRKNLETYKLHINDSKTKYMNIPFSTSLSLARQEIQEYFSNEMRSVYDRKSKEVNVSGSSWLSKKWINRIKGTLKSTGASYYGVSSLIISMIKGLMLVVLDQNRSCDSDQQKNIKRLLDALFRVIFFIYAMDNRVRTTYLVSLAIIYTNHSIKNYSSGLAEEIRKYIFDECLHVLKSPKKDGFVDFSPEKQNLLIALSDLGKNYLLPQKLLASISGYESDDNAVFSTKKSLDYFQLVSLLFYVKDHDCYSELRTAIIDSVVSKISMRENIQIYSEYTMLILDSLSCPYIDEKVKKAIASIAVIAANGSASNKNGINNKLITSCMEQDWFISWKSYVDIEHLLNKKELKTPYE